MLICQLRAKVIDKKKPPHRQAILSVFPHAQCLDIRLQLHSPRVQISTRAKKETLRYFRQIDEAHILQFKVKLLKISVCLLDLVLRILIEGLCQQYLVVIAIFLLFELGHVHLNQLVLLVRAERAQPLL